MQTKTLFIVLGILFLCLGITIIIISLLTPYKNTYDIITDTKAGSEPENLIKITNIIGGVLISVGIGFLILGILL